MVFIVESDEDFEVVSAKKSKLTATTTTTEPDDRSSIATTATKTIVTTTSRGDDSTAIPSKRGRKRGAVISGWTHVKHILKAIIYLVLLWSYILCMDLNGIE